MPDSSMSDSELKEFLEEKYLQFNRPEFIETDPIQIPHLFSAKQDIEIAAFLSATIAWGQRKTIIKNAKRIVDIMGGNPYEFICNAEDSDFEQFSDFKHRTFNGIDCIYFLKSLQNIYRNHGGLAMIFERKYQEKQSLKDAIIRFREIFFELPCLARTRKHVANIEKQSAAKRLNMFLMWMIRKDTRGVHFGIWKNISPADLFIPIDVHCGRTARKLGLLKRKQNDWKAVIELTNRLKSFDPNDPVKYDFALFNE
jgi:uncharacterized protein (TIGR02757 family)